MIAATTALFSELWAAWSPFIVPLVAAIILVAIGTVIGFVVSELEQK